MQWLRVNKKLFALVEKPHKIKIKNNNWQVKNLSVHYCMCSKKA